MLGESPATATAMGVSLVALSGMPPSPLFLSELLIVLGGVAAGDLLVSAIAVIALALGFLGLLHALIEGVIGEPGRRPPTPPIARGATDPRPDRGPQRRHAGVRSRRPVAARLRVRRDPHARCRCDRPSAESSHGAWRAAIEDALAAGEQFGGAWASEQQWAPRLAHAVRLTARTPRDHVRSDSRRGRNGGRSRGGRRMG